MEQDAVLQRKPNIPLRDARRSFLSKSGSGRPMSRQDLADEVNAYLYGGSSDRPRFGGIDAKYIGKLERGVYRWPNEAYREAFRHVLNVVTDSELGFFVIRQPRRTLTVFEPAPLSISILPAVQMPETAGALDGNDWPAWFGMRLAQAISIIHDWTGALPDILQTLLHQEILMFDAATPDRKQSTFESSRRQALVTLATLPLSLGATFGLPMKGPTTEFFLTQCSASLTACWHMLKGSDLNTVNRILNGYLLRLETIARQPSKHQAPAARLASQGHRINGIIALHRNNIRAREHHCKQAVAYASLAGDVQSQVSALISLASTYFYESKPNLAADTYEEALAFDAGMAPLQRSRTRAELSVVYGQLGRERETLEAAEVAEQLYPDMPENDPSYLYAEFTRASLTLEQGLAYAALAQRRPKQGYQLTAAKIFSRIDQVSQVGVPDRIRYEIINHQASTAVLLQDFEAFSSHLARGIEGAVLLGSRQREREVQSAWRMANQRWPSDPKLKALGRDLMPALTSN